MNFLSVSSGISAASLAWGPLGWKACAFSEIEPFPCAVLAHHYPNTPNLGDMTKFHEWPDTLRPDILEGGTPCQGFSVAGLRGGLDDPRSALSITFVEIAAKYRPTWLVWENVPGVFSSAGGSDFAEFLGALTGRRLQVPEGGWGNAGTIEGIAGAYGIAWRVLDAQFSGVPQRRRRVFVVGYLGDWRRAAAVLFERESLRGDSPPGREAGEGVAPTLSSRPSGGGGLGTDFDLDGGLDQAAISPTVSAKWAKGSGGPSGGPSGDECQNLLAVSPPLTTNPWGDNDGREGLLQVTHALRGEGFDASEDGTGRGTPLVPVAFDCKASGRNGFGVGEISPTLRSMGHANSHQNAGGQVAVCFNLRGREGGAIPEVDADGLACQRAASGGSSRSYVAFDTTQITSAENRSNPQPGDPCHPLAAGAHAHAIAIQDGALRENPNAGPQGKGYQEELADTIEAREALSKQQCVATSAVRRLTPRECERLQGFPDDFTLIPWRGRPAEDCPDGPRYKALGNSMAVPVMRWIGERIAQVEALTKQEA